MSHLTFGLFLLLVTGMFYLPETQAQKAPKPNSHKWLEVINVAEDDSLNLRSKPVASANIIVNIPFNGKNIVFIARSGKWMNVMYQGHQGWVHSKYVNFVEQAETLPSKIKGLHCLGTEPHWNINPLNTTTTLNILGSEASLTLNSQVTSGRNRTNQWLLTYTSEAGFPETFTTIIEQQSCGDGMSDTQYPYTIFLMDNKNNALYSGCCKAQ